MSNNPCDYKEKNPKVFFTISNDPPAVVRQMQIPIKMPSGEIVKGYNSTWADHTVRDQGKEIRIPEIVVFCFNLNYPKEKIKSLFEIKLNQLIKKRKILLKKYGIKPAYRQAQISKDKIGTRTPRSLYDEYLRIWDYVEIHKNMKTWAWIAKKLYPKGSVSEHKLLERYEACKKLIEGGYVDIK